MMANTHEQLRLAAQADLMLLTAEMLRQPNPQQIAQGNAWWQMPMDDYQGLVSLSESRDCQWSDAVSQFEQLASDQLPTLPKAFTEAYQSAISTDVESWSDECWRLFEGSQACPLNQASYIRRDKGTILGDLAGFYAAFGWKSNPCNGERPDHLVTQLEFIGMLLAMAAQTQDEQQRSITQSAIADFAKLHMHDWLPSVCAKMIETTHLAYYGAAAQWILALWINLTHQHKWPIERIDQEIQAPAMDPEDPYECGAPDLVNISLQST